MDYIYWVVSRACNQRCPHCYNNSSPEAPGLSVEEMRRCVANFPDPAKVHLGCVMLSGGEVLAWPELLYATLRELRDRYGEATELALQTNGDFLDAGHLDAMLDHGVTRIDIASMDPYHRKSTREREGALRELFATRGVVEKTDGLSTRPRGQRPPLYGMWGATEGTWIGALWPRGRAYRNNLSRARATDDFCRNWSGAKSFLNHDAAPGEGCEISLQLSDVYPCCPMTCRPIGDALHENVIAMLDRCREHPAWRALNDGYPERMGEYLGLSEEHGFKRSAELGNHCLWCDEFFAEHAPELGHRGGRTERGTVDLTIAGERLARLTSKPLR
ncbi:MAG: radical SAM protein [Phycisphaerae bacterium]